MESNMQKLAGLLKREGIPFEINYQKRFDKAPQICCPSTRVVRYGGGGCTVICNRFSYGGEKGLLELFGCGLPEAVGYLTAREAFKIIRDWYE